MKKIIFLLTFLIMAKVILAQGPPPPPPPSIYSAPDKNEINEFVSIDNNFKISFPGKPVIEKDLKENVLSVSFTVKREASKSYVNIQKFSTNIENKKDDIFRSFKEYALNTPEPFKGANIPKPKLIEEKEVKLGSVSGIEFTYEANFQYTKARIFVVNDTIYEMVNYAANWHILSRFNPEKVEAFNKESERFLNSFKFIK